jgi:hypothetical protein
MPVKKSNVLNKEPNSGSLSKVSLPVPHSGLPDILVCQVQVYQLQVFWLLVCQLWLDQFLAYLYWAFQFRVHQ